VIDGNVVDIVADLISTSSAASFRDTMGHRLVYSADWFFVANVRRTASVASSHFGLVLCARFTKKTNQSPLSRQ
jgi:hypothetical protein